MDIEDDEEMVSMTYVKDEDAEILVVTEMAMVRELVNSTDFKIVVEKVLKL